MRNFSKRAKIYSVTISMSMVFLVVGLGIYAYNSYVNSLVQMQLQQLAVEYTTFKETYVVPHAEYIPQPMVSDSAYNQAAASGDDVEAYYQLQQYIDITTAKTEEQMNAVFVDKINTFTQLETTNDAWTEDEQQAVENQLVIGNEVINNNMTITPQKINQLQTAIRDAQAAIQTANNRVVEDERIAEEERLAYYNYYYGSGN